MQEADLAALAALVADRTRATMLLTLLDGNQRSAGELAARAGVSPSLASAHLGRLVDGGLLLAERRGRRRMFRLAGSAVAEALEALNAVAPPRRPGSLRAVQRMQALQQARTCYDHLAGTLGVGLTEALERRGILRPAEGCYVLTADGERRLVDFGVDVAAARRARRSFARQCLDWSERRPHLAGALGAALADRLFALGWIRRAPIDRAIVVTAAGERGLEATFGQTLSAAHAAQ